jgi:uncharacterized protein with HEPN domain
MAIERALEITSEASRSVPDDAKIRRPQTPRHEIEAMGNWLRHRCEALEAAVIMKAVGEDPEPLRLAILDLSPIRLPGHER